MANWLNPTITTQYDVFVAEAKERDVDSATMFSAASTNQPTGSVRFNRATKIFEEWNGTTWIPLVIGVAGGGTGANTGAGAGPSLGLGSMAYQNSNAIAVSGGTATLNWLLCSFVIAPPVDLTCDLGDAGRRFNKGYIVGGLVIPVGADKYVVG
jgi:hypothetical protein